MMRLYLLFPITLSIVSFSAGLLLLTRRQKRIASFALGGTALLQGGMSLFLFLWLLVFPDRADIAFLRWSLFLGSLSPILLVLFSFYYLQRVQTLVPAFRGFTLALVGISGTVFSLLAFRPSLLRDVGQVSGKWALTFGPLAPAFSIYLILSLLVILFQMEQIFRRTKTVQRHQLNFLLLGISAGCLYSLFVASILLFNRSIYLGLLVAGAFIYMICWGMIAFAVVRHRLLEVDIFISRHVIYTSVVVFAVGLYLVIIGVLSWLIHSVGGRWDILLTAAFVSSAFILLGVILLSSTLQKSLKRFIYVHFYRYKYDYRLEWNEFTKKISEVHDLPSLLLKIIEMISDTLWVNRISIWLYNERSGVLSFSTSRNLPRKARFLSRGTPLVQYLLHHRTPLDARNPETQEIVAHHHDLFDQFHISLVVPLKIGQRPVGMITIGPELKGPGYTDEDYELLKTIAQQASNAIFSAQIIEEVAIAKETESFNKISSFLVHDLKNLVSSISLVLQNAARNIGKPEFQKDLLSTLQDATDKMRDLIEKLSTLPKEMEMKRSPVDLNELITAALETSKARNLKGVQVEADLNKVPRILADGEYVKKVLVNLILNAVQALPEGQGRIEVTSYAKDGYVHAEVLDTGTGMTKEFIQKLLFKPFTSTKKKGFGIGLFQCKAIMEAHGGSIEASSIPHRGSQFVLNFPVDQDGETGGLP